MKRVGTQRAISLYPLHRFSLPALSIIGLLFLIFSKSIDRYLLAPAAAETGSASIYLPTILHKDQQATRYIPPSQTSGVIDYDPLTDSVWVVNPDSGSVSVIDAISNQLITEIEVGTEPWSLTIAPSLDAVYVADKAEGSLIQIKASTFEIVQKLDVGAEPTAVLLHPNLQTAYVTIQTADQVAVIDLEKFELINLIPVGPWPNHMALSGNQLLVSHLIAQPTTNGEEARDDGKESIVSAIDLQSNSKVGQIILEANVHGFPNLLGSMALRGSRLWVPHTRSAPDIPNDLTNVVFAAVSMLDISEQQENKSAYLPLNDQDIFGSPINNPVAATVSGNGETLYVVSAGSDLVEAIDVSDPEDPSLIGFLATGTNPRGMTLSPDRKRGYVMNYLSRSVSILDLENFVPITDISVTDEPLSADMLRGKILFNTAKDPKMSNASWVSCASCHPDGGFDGVTWMFPDGPRQTPPVWNASNTLPWHWSAALDEMQDVEDTIQTIQHGIGLAAGGESAPLNVQLTGQSADLDALALFMAAGIRTPNVPTLSESGGGVDNGRNLFTQMGCATCHGGPTWTSSSLSGIGFPADPDQNGMIDSLLHDVG
ncbi:MAG: hypothetical protein AAGD96_22280, partial [Chloroflexota bacterium]